MSITRIKPGLGIWVKCDGTDETFCKEKRFTANIVPKHNRAHWAKTEGWGRGKRSHNRSHDLCPDHMKHEQELVAKLKAEREARKKERNEKRKAMWAEAKAKREAEPVKPKKPRKKKASTAVSAGAVTEAEEAGIGQPAPSPSAA